jgi:uncharacterized YccA/Bax inhibitor family protein
MALMKTSNPALNERTFRGMPGATYGGWSGAAERMTLNGTVNKTGLLVLCALASACWTWYLFLNTHNLAAVGPLMMLGLIGGLVLAMVTIFKPVWAGVTAPLYALAEGLALGGLSATFELRYPGVAMEAVGLTFGTLAAMLLIYRSGLIKVNDKMRLGILAATGGIAIFYLLEMVMGFFGVHFNAINGSGALGIGFSLLVVGIAALNLVLDFDFIEKGVQFGAPKYMEWYGAFSLMVTLVWLYMEMLLLLSKIRGDRR